MRGNHSAIPLSCNDIMIFIMVFVGTIFTITPSLSVAASPIQSGAEPDYPPFSFQNEQGEADGLAVELFRAAADAMDEEVTFSVRSWDLLKQDLASDQLDALPLVGRTPQRESIYDFTVPYLSLYGAIVTQKENKTIQHLDDLYGRKIGVMRGDIAEEFMQSEGFEQSLVRTESFADVLKQLDQGKLDAVVIQQLVAQQLIESLKLENVELRVKLDQFRQDFCFAVTEGDKELLATLNEGLSRVVTSGHYQQLRTKWLGGKDPDKFEFSSQASVALTESEQKWIERHPTVDFTGDPNWLPYEAFQQDGHYIGIVADHLQLIESKTGLNFEPIPVSSWSESLDIATKGRVAVISGDAADAILNKNFKPVDSYSENPIVIVMHSHENYVEHLEELKGKRIAIIKDYGYTADIFRHYPDFDFIEVENIQEGLEGVSNGKFDAMLATMALASYTINEMELYNIKVVGKTPITMELTLFVANELPELHSIINKTLKSLPPEESHNILHSWSHVDYVEKVDYTVAILTGIGLLALLLITLFWNRRLKSEIQNRVEAEKALLKSSKEWTYAMDFLDDAVYLIDLDDRVVRANRTFYLMTGLTQEQTIGHDITTILHPEGEEIPCPVCAARKDRRDEVIVMEPDHPDNPSGRPIQVMVQIIRDEAQTPLGVLMGIRDLTKAREAQAEKERLQREIHQSQKMDALGSLTGGIAHDFNNILGIIMGNVDLARIQTDEVCEEKMQKYLDTIQNASERARDLVSQMMLFSRSDPGDSQPLDITVMIKEDIKMLSSLLPSSIEIDLQYPDELPSVMMDPVKLQQLLMNLCLNAKDAMNGVGKLSVDVRVVQDVEVECSACFHQFNGEWLKLSIIDSGTGIDSDALKYIFDPFFTTKEVGKGTGMGLAVVASAVHSLDGHITVESEKGKGSSFHLYFPPVEDDSFIAGKAEHSTHLPARGDSKRVLVIDDEPELVQVISEILQVSGYQPSSITDSVEALKQFKAEPESFDLVITDQTMPHYTGVELANNMRQLRPDIPIILTTGYSDAIDQQKAAELKISFLKNR